MATPTTAQKKVAIDFLLSVGDTEYTMFPQNMRDVLRTLSDTGVDYDRSETPQMQVVTQYPSDDYNSATFMTAFAATIYANNGDHCRIIVDGKSLLGVSFNDMTLRLASADCEGRWKTRLAEMDARLKR